MYQKNNISSSNSHLKSGYTGIIFCVILTSLRSFETNKACFYILLSSTGPQNQFGRSEPAKHTFVCHFFEFFLGCNYLTQYPPLWKFYATELEHNCSQKQS